MIMDKEETLRSMCNHTDWGMQHDVDIQAILS